MSQSGSQSIARLPVQLLWTGGWDSTFRLLQLLLEHEKDVQPHYLVDSGRPSTLDEFRAMNEIKRELFARYPQAKSRLAPTVLHNACELPTMPLITESYERLRKNTRLGSQYEWLAKYCVAFGLQGMEIGITGLIAPLASPSEDGPERTYAIGEVSSK